MRTEKTPAYRMAMRGIWRLRWKSFIIRLIYGILSIGSLFVGATLYGERIPEETNDILLILLHYDNMLFMGLGLFFLYKMVFHMDFTPNNTLSHQKVQETINCFLYFRSQSRLDAKAIRKGVLNGIQRVF